MATLRRSPHGRRSDNGSRVREAAARPGRLGRVVFLSLRGAKASLDQAGGQAGSYPNAATNGASAGWSASISGV